jgi:uncharacterized protein YndB with AHSA1/START domain
MPDIRHLIDIKADPAAVFELASTPEGLAKWWAEDIFDISADSCSLGFFNRNTVYTLRMDSKVPNQKMLWRSVTGQEWEGTRLLFELQDRGKSTALRFTHADWRSETEYFFMCNTTWGELMFRLAAAAEGKGRGPLFRKSALGY